MGMNVSPGASTDKSAESKRRIVHAARMQIESKGILGLRVQDVARNAGVSVPLIYKYFGDRDGLLAEVLSEMFEDWGSRRLAAASAALASAAAGADAGSVVQAFLPQRDPGAARERALALQILAAAVEIPSLAVRLAETQKSVHSQMVGFIAAALGPDDPASVAALAMLVQAASLGFVYNDMLGDKAVDHGELAGIMGHAAESLMGGHAVGRS